VINEAKRLDSNDKITNSNNTSKITWNIIGVDLGKNRPKGKNYRSGKINQSILNIYFLNVVDNITHKTSTLIISDTDSNKNDINIL
jgi:hypothetical protein